MLNCVKEVASGLPALPAPEQRHLVVQLLNVIHALANTRCVLRIVALACIASATVPRILRAIERAIYPPPAPPAPLFPVYTQSTCANGAAEMDRWEINIEGDGAGRVPLHPRPTNGAVEMDLDSHSHVADARSRNTQRWGRVARGACGGGRGQRRMYLVHEDDCAEFTAAVHDETPKGTTARTQSTANSSKMRAADARKGPDKMKETSVVQPHKKSESRAINWDEWNYIEVS
ncbi:hypothetical protein B0H17DRAFT_1186234 [Mycena rosella]|uniref:Uncharacterized protein n=1 Tax=Mycena rosella TaxID=1033263 RepID=A0AAD7G0E1_MYCRO|nr:hypothetical protein B0H17DRAFT_1186234 [Mycena rosella]